MCLPCPATPLILDKQYIDLATFEELKWLGSCIEIESHDLTTPTKSTKNISVCSLSGPITNGKRKRSDTFDGPHHTSSLAPSHDVLHPTEGLSDSESEKRDIATPLRDLRPIPPTEDRTKTRYKSQLSLTKPREFSNPSDIPAIQKSFTHDADCRPKSSREMGSFEPIVEKNQPSSFISRSPASPHRQMGYCNVSPPAHVARTAIDSRQKAHSVLHQSSPPLWTSALRQKSKSPRSIPSLKSQPSPSIPTHETPPVSVFKPPATSWHTREPSTCLDHDELKISSLSSQPITLPLPIPRFPSSHEDVFGKSSPTWLPGNGTPIVGCRKRSRPAAIITPPLRKNSAASSATTSSTGMDGASTPGSSKSVKFAEKPIIHYPNTLYWDQDSLEELPPVDISSMDLEEILEIESPMETAPPMVDASISSLGSIPSEESFAMLESPTAMDHPPSPPATINKGFGSGALTSLFTGKKKDIPSKPISGPFTLSVGATHRTGGRHSSCDSSRPTTPSTPGSRPTTPTSISSIPTSRSAPSSVSMYSPEHRRRLAKHPASSRQSVPQAYPLANSASDSKVLGSTESLKSATSTGAKSFPESRKSRGRWKFW